MGLLFLYPMEAKKKHWTDLLDMHVILPKLKVSVVFYSSNEILLTTIIKDPSLAIALSKVFRNALFQLLLALT